MSCGSLGDVDRIDIRKGHSTRKIPDHQALLDVSRSAVFDDEIVTSSRNGLIRDERDLVSDVHMNRVYIDCARRTRIALLAS